MTLQIGGDIPCAKPCHQIPIAYNKKEKKATGRKRKRTEAEAQEDHSITINEAQLQFDQLYKEEFMKLDEIYRKDIIGIDNTLGVEGFEEFKRCASVDQKRYLVFSHMMIYALDNLHTDSIVTNQTTGALNRKIENLVQEQNEDKQKISSMKIEMRRLQLKNTAASMKVNKLLDEIGNLKKKLLENQQIVPDLNASTEEDQNFKDPVEEHTHDKDTAIEDPVQDNANENDVAMKDPEQGHATDCDPDENEEDQAEEDQGHEGKDFATEKGTSGVQQDVHMQTPTSKDPEEQGKETAKKKTRTLIKNVRKRDDRKPNVDPQYDYIPIQKKKKKAKYIYAVSDSESPSIVPSQSQPLEPIIQKEKEQQQQPKVKSPLNPIAEETAKNHPKKPKQTKEKLDKRDKQYRLPASTRAYKLLEDETKEKFKEYYRQQKM